ncbi:sulfite exporter TauE/SafE family protein [Mesobacillus zeae]|uniref:Probable membrane transporter protein n=1 Tax=Mesobacillus zeae TaxID=1917180 RepID=A0A398B8M3_9BACI|nr:sulfite exporter TauE/SafE family protein [Mesobacillus zeae]RID84250.1 sulfite exporter TauE/SafE family protein [Mesobacillus zeae]
MELIIFFLLGGFISILSGFFGVGGGFILTPVLLLIGLSPLEAITTSLLFTVGTSSSGILAHISLGNIRWTDGLVLGLSGAVATQAAHPFVFFLESRGWDAIAIPSLYIVMLSYFAYQMIKPRVRESHSLEGRHLRQPWKLFAIGLGAGFTSAAMGVGGGFLIVPLLVTLLGFEPRKAVGTSLLAVLMIAGTGFASYATEVHIDYLHGALLVCGGLAGSQLGARLTAFFKNGEMKPLLGTLYIVMVSGTVFKLLHYDYAGLSAMGLFMLFFLLLSVLKIRNGRASLRA